MTGWTIIHIGTRFIRLRRVDGGCLIGDVFWGGDELVDRETGRGNLVVFEPAEVERAVMEAT